MSRSDDAKIAEWLGWYVDTNCEQLEFKHHEDDAIWQGVPWFSSEDTAAIQLLPVLVERGHWPDLSGDPESGWIFTPCRCHEHETIDSGWQPTIAAAISGAVLRLIEEVKDGNL